ncbi:MAG: paraquat-inducible protein A [Motiliproteus sp.]|nr:paraquat-inducible protein A [Motiliproteus sp.]MCW9051589.1 paraquat-inducible protein A [Motiliproteus sp.]
MQITASRQNRLECHECGRLHQVASGAEAGRYHCGNCNHHLYSEQPAWLSRALAFTFTGLVLFVVSNVFPFMALELGSFSQQTTLLSGVQLLLDNNQFGLALLVLGTIFLFPLMELVFLAYVLLPPALEIRVSGYRSVLSWLGLVSKWNMMEVFLLAVLVSAVKLREMADIVPGIALYSYFSLVFILVLAKGQLNRRELWSFYQSDDCFRTNADEKLVGCSQCQALIGEALVQKNLPCPRCLQKVQHRVPHSLQKTAALLLAAVVFYIPANTLPIMITTSLGQTQADTILSGVLYLLHGDTWPLAVIVFVASMLVPVSKILILFYLWWTVVRQSIKSPMQRMKLYRLTEFVGHWSMVDVYVVILMVALVQFGVLANVEAGDAAFAFGGVVVLTMLAAASFDPRLIWDALDQSEAGGKDKIGNAEGDGKRDGQGNLGHSG